MSLQIFKPRLQENSFHQSYTFYLLVEWQWRTEPSQSSNQRPFRILLLFHDVAEEGEFYSMGHSKIIYPIRDLARRTLKPMAGPYLYLHFIVWVFSLLELLARVFCGMCTHVLLLGDYEPFKRECPPMTSAKLQSISLASLMELVLSGSCEIPLMCKTDEFWWEAIAAYIQTHGNGSQQHLHLSHCVSPMCLKVPLIFKVLGTLIKW